MSKPFKLSELDQFIGTQRYYRMSSRVVLTDGTHYLAERVGCYWLMDVIASHVLQDKCVDASVLDRKRGYSPMSTETLPAVSAST